MNQLDAEWQTPVCMCVYCEYKCRDGRFATSLRFRELCDMIVHFQLNVAKRRPYRLASHPDKCTCFKIDIPLSPDGGKGMSILILLLKHYSSTEATSASSASDDGLMFGSSRPRCFFLSMTLSNKPISNAATPRLASITSGAV